MAKFICRRSDENRLPRDYSFGDLSETEYFFIKLCGFLRVLSRDGDMFDLCHGAVADRFVQ